MKKLNAILATLFLLGLPLAAAAMEGHGEHGTMTTMEHGKMEGMKHEGMHEGMMMEGGMIMLGDDTQEGVKAMAHLKDVSEAMEKMGMTQTHHLMVMFMNTETGKPIEAGTVAVKIKDPSGHESEAIKLMGMQGHFGADVSLTEKGEYEFTVGTKLEDGMKRQYEFHHTVE